MGYLTRTIDAELDELLPWAAAIALDGPKGVGKTATADARAVTSFLLDQPAHRELLEADPLLEHLPEGTVLLDEWQRLPQLWDAVRRAVDAGAPGGRFLLTGSATPRAGVDTHSGAGRILSLRMRPMALHERPGSAPTVSLAALLRGQHGPVFGSTTDTRGDYFEAIVAGGFPGIIDLPQALRVRSLDTYLQRIIDRDLPDQGFSVRRPETLRRWLAAYAAASSTTTAYARLLPAATSGEGPQPAKTTTIAYRDHLAALWLLDPVPGWSPSGNPFTRLQQASKHQLADPALAARLLGLSATSLGLPRGAAMAGALFESLATLGVRVAAQAAGARVGHLRTGDGDHEVDLIVEGSEGEVLGIEVKLAATASDDDVRHLHWLRERLGDAVTELIVITTGQRAFRRADGVVSVPLALLGP